MNDHRKSEWASENNLCEIVCQIEMAGRTRTPDSSAMEGERRNETWTEFQNWIKQKNFYLHTQTPFGFSFDFFGLLIFFFFFCWCKSNI